MKVMTECEVFFEQDIDAETLTDAVSGPLVGGYSRLEDIECRPQHGQVVIATLIGNFNHPNRTNEDEDELDADISQLVFDILIDYGFPVREVQIQSLEYLEV